MPDGISHNGTMPIPVYTMRDMGLTGVVPGFRIHRLEDSFQRGGRDVRAAHRHDFYRVGLVNAGRGSVTADLGDYPIKPPMLLQFAPGVVHGWRPDQVPRGYVIDFERTFFGQDPGAQAELVENNLFCVHSGPRVLSLNAKQRQVFEQLATAMRREAESRGTDHAAALLSYLRLWLIEAGRVAQALQPAQPLNDRGAELTNRFLCLVGGNYKSLSSVSDYAARLGVSSNHLNETVRRVMQKTAGQVIRERMLMEAKRLLLHSELSVSEIAYQLSFEDPSYFARFFRKHTGQAPAEFRAQS